MGTRREIKVVSIHQLDPTKSRIRYGLLWLGDHLGGFSVKSTYNVVETEFLGADLMDISKKILKISPPKVAIFLWQVFLNKIVVKENLIKRGWW